MIRFRAFAKSYGTQRALAPLTLEIGRGEVVALLGPNGSGKTTTLKGAAGLVRPSSGEVWLGDPPRPARDPAARRILSYLPQRVSFPDALTGNEVVAFYCALRSAAPERGGEVLRFASLNGAGARSVATYSGGMLQRLGLAVALVPDAPLFLLDEPTAALDPAGLRAFYEVIERARERGRTVLLTSHQLGDAERLADRFAVLVDGRLVADLGAGELKDRLSERGVMRLRLASQPTALLASVRELAPEARCLGEELLVPGKAAARPRVLDLLRSRGVEIRALTVEEGRLDDLYRDLVGEAAPPEGASQPLGGGEP